jgi:hypothetical protein
MNIGLAITLSAFVALILSLVLLRTFGGHLLVTRWEKMRDLLCAFWSLVGAFGLLVFIWSSV